MNPEQIREVLIQAGIDPAELDDVHAPPLLQHFAELVKTTVQNDSALSQIAHANMQMMHNLMLQQVQLDMKVKQLEAKING